jgi:peroxidase
MPSTSCNNPTRHRRGLFGPLSVVLLLLVASLPASAATATNETATLDEAQQSYLQDPEPEVDEFLQAVDAQSELLADPDVSTSEATALSTVNQISPSPPPSICGIPVTHPEVRLRRIVHSDYGDGISTLAGASRDSARLISNTVLEQSGSIPNVERASDIFWQWGQFIDHDIDLTPTGDEYEPIDVPLGDPFFDRGGIGGQVLPFYRSIFDPTTGTDVTNPRQQVNVITSRIDASNVYGSDQTRSSALRAFDGKGRLKNSSGDLLPYNTAGLDNAPDSSPTYFLAGDVRSNEQVALTSMHTLWMREHNYWAIRLGNSNPWMTEEDRFQAARSVVMAEEQIITYQEFLPLLLGSTAIPSYTGYNPFISGDIANVFSTAAYRLGHTMLSDTIQRLKANGTPIAAGPLALRDAFFQPTQLSSVGVDPYMKGLASQVMQEIDTKVVDGVRNFLFITLGSGLDLAALNIQRGRDHGLPDYNIFRDHFGSGFALNFSDITSDATVQTQLDGAYHGDINDIDVWVGALAEDHVAGTLVGRLLLASLAEQFIRTRDGDPCWYRNRLNPGAATALEQQTLAKVIARNTLLKRSDLQHNVFVVP